MPDGNPRYVQIVFFTNLSVLFAADIMKNQELLPAVQKEHAPYEGHAEGEVIHDHDVALAYVLEHYPSVLPSYAVLPEKPRKLVLFALSKMVRNSPRVVFALTVLFVPQNFNHGWFVQGEAPPSAALASFKAMIARGASSSDIAFYFVHWITDLAGAVPTPLAGAEKLVAQFPHFVLTSFLWSMPFLQRLADGTETEVNEQYLLARWKSHPSNAKSAVAVPSGAEATCLLRLLIMSQCEDAAMVKSSFYSLSTVDQRCLTTEMALTGLAGQSYASSPSADQSEGPAFLIYYGNTAVTLLFGPY